VHPSSAEGRHKDIPVKILEVTNFFSPVHGGSAEAPYQLSKELGKRGHKVTIYTSDFKLTQDYVNSVPQATVRPFRTWLSMANLYVTPGIISSARKEIERMDIIHMHNYRTFQNTIAHRYARKYNVPYVLQAHGSLPRIMSRQRLKQAYDIIWGYQLLKDASRVLAVTRTEAEQYKNAGIGKDKIEIIPHGIDLSAFENLPPRGEFRRKHGLGDDQRIVLYLGRIHQIKGLDLLAGAFAALSKSLNDTRLVIAGPDDGYLSSLKKSIADLKIKDRVLLTGPLYGQEKLAAYVDADVCVLPSVYEIFGITILEALACGTPVIATDRCGLAEAIGEQAGLVVPYDKGQLQNALSQMLGDDKLRQKFGEKGKLLVRDKFNWEKIAEQVERVYTDIL